MCTGHTNQIQGGHRFTSKHHSSLQIPKLKPSNTKLISYIGEDLKITGSCELRCGEKVLNFFIVKTNQCPILSFKASQELNLIRVVMNVKTQELDDLVT